MAHYSSSYPTACRLFSPVTNTSLILDGVGVNVLIADVHATVQISQRFTNPRNFPLDATYTFGLLAGAAICGFKMVRADGTEINGVVKEKEAAKKDYDKAVRKGQTAALGAEETKDVFSISVGNVSANETVTIEFQYVQLLTDDEKRNQIRFMFPRVYAQRYGSAPSINAATAFRAPRQQFTMTVVVQQSSTIKGISCASGHPMQLELGKPEGFEVDSSISDSQLAKVTVSDSSGSLNEDILLVITADGLDNPRCFVEPHPVDDTLAMGLTFVPRFTLPDVSGGMEYIFLVDRSGSMEGNSMKLLREALVVLLRGLPSKGTKFNIVSFGSHATKFWPTSQAYTQANLDSATKHVDSMNADYGGTEIASALNLVYSSLSTPLSQPVAVFLLTDGGAWDVATCVSRTKHAISQQATQENFMRIFTLGIGAGASSNTCDSIAKAGEGFSVYVGSNEPIVGKCARLVRAARTPPVTNLQIFWTGKEPHGESEHDFELVDESGRDAGHASQKSPSGPAPGVVSLFDDKESEIQDVGPPPPVTVSLPPPPHVQQAPLQSPSLFPGTRSQMYCILAKQPKVLPTSLIVRGTVVSTGASVELTVPISTVLQARGSRLAFLHILSAKALISDREHQIHAFPPSISSSFRDDDALRDAYLKADIVRLGVLYGLTSRHTSFVAVDRRTGQPKAVDRVSSAPSKTSSISPDLDEAVSLVRDILGTGGSTIGSRSLQLSTKSRVYQRNSSNDDHDDDDDWDDVHENDLESDSDDDEPVARSNIARALFFGNETSGPSVAVAPLVANPTGWLNPQMSLHTEIKEKSGRPSTLQSAHARRMPPAAPSSPPPLKQYDHLARLSTFSGETRKVSTQMNDGERLAALARLQCFDGGFTLTKELLQLLDLSLSYQEAQDVCTKEGIDQEVLATVLARSWLVKNGGEGSLDMQDKSWEWLVARLGSSGAVAGILGKLRWSINLV